MPYPSHWVLGTASVGEVPQTLLMIKKKLIRRVPMVQLCMVVPAEHGEKDLKPIGILVSGEFLSQHIDYGFSPPFGQQVPVQVDLTSKMMDS